MKERNLSAFIFPSTDPHQGEYIPDHWKGREWISGFNGSAGIAVVTQKSAALWTDSRYFIAAAEQLKGTDYILMKERIAETPSISEWLASEFKGCEDVHIGIDGWVCTNTYATELIWTLKDMGDFYVHTGNNPALTGQILVNCARATMRLTPGCYTMPEIPVIDYLPASREEVINTLV